ncbi:pyridoxamine 5'-phosphate oxidase family protein [Halegenticoccus tardaugens]|uniref:pyridoxamine 5'-phosphate oxidase family protein n=1 Tax=Halegenticoccus tardaugens TaxID=2071624 RepID=UPI001E2D6654|nr:pyridoxamine 5'-phosphate oxidase family protein [Halegenticoccus tardaugens]
MTASDIDRLQGNRMTEAEAKSFLRERGTGVLSLAAGDEAYGVPISAGYDGESTLYFAFVGFGEKSRKTAFAERTERASFVVYEATTPADWRSVVVEGAVSEVERANRSAAMDALEDNAWYPSLFSEADPMEKLRIWALEIDSVSGLRGADAR